MPEPNTNLSDDSRGHSRAGRRLATGARGILRHRPRLSTPHTPEWGARPWPSRVLHRFGEVAALSWAGIVAAIAVGIWGVLGVVVRFPSWWQTALYSVTSATTFVMVFVIQHTQARQTSAMQRKLDELVRSGSRSDDSLIAIEEALDEELQALADRSVAGRQQAVDAELATELGTELSEKVEPLEQAP